MNAYEKFSEVMNKHADFGSRDTEPRAVVRDMLRYAFAGKRMVPQTGRDWQIYTVKDGSERAANDLTKAANELIDYIFAIPLRDVTEEKEKAAEIFWIDDWEIYP